MCWIDLKFLDYIAYQIQEIPKHFSRGEEQRYYIRCKEVRGYPVTIPMQ